MSKESLPDQYNIPNYILCSSILSPKKDYIVLTSKIKIKPYREVKIKIKQDFYNLVKSETIQVFIMPYYCRYTYYIQYRLIKNVLYIKTNARDYSTKNKYCTLNLLLIGERWDTYVVNKLQEDF